jgi:predicted transcriptional regulator
MTLPQVESIIVLLEEARQDLTSVFHRVNNVLPEDQDALCISIDTPLIEALALMKKHNYSQIPIKAGDEVLGIFSYRSFAQRITEFMDEKINLDQIPIGEFIEHAGFVDVLDDLVSTLDTLDKKDVILVGDRKNLKGILTPIDLVKYLYKLSSPFVLLGEIEKGIRNIIRDSVTPEQLQDMIQQTLSQIYLADKMPKSLEEMTFNDYVQFIGDGRAWKYFEGVFGLGDLQRKRTRAKLEVLRDLRNDAFHFKRDLLEDDINKLVVCRDWIKNAVTACQVRKVGKLI